MKPSLQDWSNCIVVTGANGFIGMNLIEQLLVKGFESQNPAFPKPENILVLGVDLAETLDRPLANRFMGSARYRFLSHVEFLTEIETLAGSQVQNAQKKSLENKPLCVFHNGACSSTTETRAEIFESLNTGYSERLWNACAALQIPFLYASSAATYGSGEFGFSDELQNLSSLVPLNLYGKSKLDFDKWAAQKSSEQVEQPDKKLTPPAWFGLRYFNVYGPYERHKGGQASMVLHGYDQITRTGKIKLFESNSAQYSHGNQVRDFVYVKDVVKFSLKLLELAFTNSKWKSMLPDGCNGWNGCFLNIGTGNTRTWNELATCVAAAMNMQPKIEYIPIPKNIAAQYQNYTKAELKTLRGLNLSEPFTSLENGVKETVQRYLCRGI